MKVGAFSMYTVRTNRKPFIALLDVDGRKSPPKKAKRFLSSTGESTC